MNTVRTVADAKHDFYKAFSKPVNSIYRRVVDELLVEVHLLRVSQNFGYDSIFALGLATAFDRFMAGYQPESDLEPIFKGLCQALLFDPDQIRQESAHLIELSKQFPAEVKSLFTTLEAGADLDTLMGQIRAIATNPKFKYSRLFAVGVFILLETADPEAIADQDKRQALITQVGDTLKINSERLLKDLDLYRSNLEKIQQGRQMMEDMVEAERKKREKKAKSVISS
ncbi:photosystem II biogenesis protein Psp29 [Synechococcus sp. PCC 7502]|uniref:photosystem II biogenesis protein Psp29 n=1 Tax=Synechococcus sp. PCC 7502 TaxID=1173263 RepID=UPI00029FE4AE|nr:photosystem II biogenesis protein Psp29 [Synechococcus sp. PCC 7502]AFY75172.1 photosystem II biogenesis protein Psp29 [Synechococcus sp. PCC 7502]